MISRAEGELISKIVLRARALGVERPIFRLTMDIEKAHDTVPINFEALLAFEMGDFMHDVCGIINCLDRNTGRLTNHFVPRSAACYHD